MADEQVTMALVVLVGAVGVDEEKWHRVVISRQHGLGEPDEVLTVDFVLEAPPSAREFVVDQVVEAVRVELLRCVGLAGLRARGN